MSIPVEHRTDVVLSLCEEALREHYSAQRDAISSSLQAQGTAPYLPPAIASAHISVRAQTPAGPQAVSSLRIVPVAQVSRPSGVGQQASTELPVAVACVVRGEDCSISSGEDRESALVRAAYATAEAVRRVLTALASQQSKTVIGQAGIGGVISAQVEHDLHLLRPDTKEVTGVIVLLTVVFRQKTRV